MSDAFIGNIFFERGDGGSPEAYERVCEVFSIGGVGETNALEDVTTFCSGGFREYIAGLSDGEEMTIEANYGTSNTLSRQMIDDVKAKANRNYRLVIEDGSPQVTLSYAGTPLSWTLNPSVDSRNTISFTVKISGQITVSP